MPRLERCKYLPHANMVVQRGEDNVVALVPGRTGLDDHSHTVEKYCKFAYSSKFGFSVSRSPYTLAQGAPDSMLCFRVGELFYVKTVAEPGYTVGDMGLTYRWSPLPGIRVWTRMIPTETGHIREHTVQSNLECTAYDCGFAVNADDRLETGHSAVGSTAEVRCGDDFCAVSSLNGDGKGEVLLPDPNTSLMFPKTAIPMVTYHIRIGVQTLRSQVDYFS